MLRRHAANPTAMIRGKGFKDDLDAVRDMIAAETSTHFSHSSPRLSDQT